MTAEVTGRNSVDRASRSSNNSSSEEDERDVAAQRMVYDMARTLVVQEVEPWRVTAWRVKVDLGGPVLEVSAAPHSTTRVLLEGEDIGTTPVVDSFEWKDAAMDTTPKGGAAASGVTYIDKIKLVATCTTEYNKKLATTMYEKVAGVGTVVAGKVQQVTQSAGTMISGIGGASQS
uniref:Uncharacterized protein n=1 Tax=Oryza glumipatula TaxID=40148 RepID=A0A0D9Z9X6_9ORYZ